MGATRGDSGLIALGFHTHTSARPSVCIPIKPHLAFARLAIYSTLNTHTHTHTNTNIHTHTHIHTLTQTHIHTHTLIHTDTHSVRAVNALLCVSHSDLHHLSADATCDSQGVRPQLSSL